MKPSFNPHKTILLTTILLLGLISQAQTVTYLWSNGATTPNIVVNPQQTTTYYLTMTQNGVQYFDSLVVNVLDNETYYADNDGDGFGNYESTTESCTGAPVGYVSDNTDCDDGNALVYLNASCDDNNPCTINDIILADCSCAGAFADADNDGTCDANDNCAGPEAGTACDDSNPCTVNDIIRTDCSCQGFEDITPPSFTGAFSDTIISVIPGIPVIQMPDGNGFGRWNTVNSAGLVTGTIVCSPEVCGFNGWAGNRWLGDTLIWNNCNTGFGRYYTNGLYIGANGVFCLPPNSENSGLFVTECYLNDQPAPPTPIDSTDPNPTLIYLGETISPGDCEYIQLVRTKLWVASDQCGNLSDTVSQTQIVLIEFNGPNFILYDYLVENSFIDTVSCDETIEVQSPVMDSLAIGQTQCSQYTIAIVSDTTFIDYSWEYGVDYQRREITWNIAAGCGPSWLWTKTYIIIDTIAPEITLPGNDTIINYPDTPIFTPPTLLNENCGVAFIYQFDDYFDTLDCSGSYNQTRRWIAYDESYNFTEELSQTITVLITACDDGNPCTINDIILTDCSCAGTFADADSDGTCDANDLCAGPEAGAACDDNNPCTVGDVILADCSCAGTFADADNDGTCDANDNCLGQEAGTACDDNNPCTVNDIILADCSCAGTFADADNDGTCDANDLCAGPEAGAACDDNDPCTVNDVILADCSCAGTFADADNDGTCDANDNCAGPEAGTACDDNDPCTVNDFIRIDCSCRGDEDITPPSFSGAFSDTIIRVIPGIPVIQMPDGFGQGAWNMVNEDGVVNGAIVCTPEVCGLSGWAGNRWMGDTLIWNPIGGNSMGRYYTNGFYATPSGYYILPEGSANAGLTYTECYFTNEIPPPVPIDNVDANPNLIYLGETIAPGDCEFIQFVRTKLWVASDQCGNLSDTVSQTQIVLTEFNGPNFLLYDYLVEQNSIDTVSCDETIEIHSPVMDSLAIGQTQCSQYTITLASDTSFIDFSWEYGVNFERRVITWRIEAGCGPSWLWPKTYIIIDTIAPSITPPGSDTIIYYPEIPVFTPPTVSDDNCGLSFIYQFEDYFDTLDCSGSYNHTRRWIAYDESYNFTEELSQTITVLITACDDGNPCTSNDSFQADCSCAGTFADADNDGTCDSNDNCAGPEAGSSCDDNDPCTTGDIILADCSCAGTFADTDNDGTCDATDNCAGPEAGAACDDNDPCTVNDIILADCSCAGTFADADNDGTCDATDNCAGPEAGAACDDNDPCTVGDVILAGCLCAGTFADADNDGTCDANDLCAGPEAGAACDDNDPCTVGDVILADCSCVGTFADADNDGTCDANDDCAGPEAGAACDDNDPCTTGDIILADCSCSGTFADADNDGTCDANDNCAGPEAGTACNDNNPCTVSDVILADCSCAGTFADADNDGTCDANDLCAGAEPGSSCDDNNPCTVNDIILADCSCAGTFADADNDGTCDANDLCAGPEAGNSCDDNDPCTAGDVILADCSCAGTFADADNDGTCDANDLCAGPEAGAVCDDNDPCTVNDIILADCSCAGTFVDADNDGTCDANDVCSGAEPGSECNDGDPCTIDDMVTADCSCMGTFADSDNDGTCDANDVCNGPEPGSACEDGDPCTTGDLVQADCSCRGTAVEPQFSSVSAQACGPYTWNGNTYSQSGTYVVTLQNAAGCDSIAQLVLSIGAPTTSNETATACTSYTWNGTTYTQSGTYTFVSTNASGCPNTATLNLTINTLSVAPTGASASQTSVSAGTQVTLTVQGGSLGTGASWKWYRSACGGTLIGTGSSITVTANVTNSYFVRAEGTCNTTACASVTVNVLTTACGPQNVTASATTICAGSSTTLTVTGSTGTGGTWRWYRNGCGSGTCIGTGASITVSPNSNTTYFVRSEGGSCGTTSCRSIAIVVNPLPAKPSNINGITSGLCGSQNVTYSISSCTGATSYQWTVPSGVNIVSGQGTASITVNFSTTLGNNSSCGSPAICVRSGNSCGWSSYYCKDVQLAPSTPGSISGSSTPCRNQPNVYSISSVAGATSYQWTVPNGYNIQSGQGTTSITVLPGSTSGSIGVRAVNACGTSSIATKSVRPKTCSSSMPMTFDLWPNPTSERVYFAYDEEQPELMEIYDMMGRTIYSGSWLGEFDVTSLAGGIYFVRATSGEESVVKRMEVVR
jgi:hypothetical protein